MTLQPLLAASPAIQIHAVAALLAVVVGLLQFALARGSRLHRGVGWFWIGLMLVTVLSSFFIHNIRLLGLWSPIHLLSIVALCSLARAVWAIRHKAVRSHRLNMIYLFLFALVGAGSFTLLPGRLMHAVVFGG